MLEVIDPFFVSRPSAIILDFILLFTSKDIFPHLGVTLYATLLGLALYSVSGLVLAFMLGKFRPRKGTRPSNICSLWYPQAGPWPIIYSMVWPRNRVQGSSLLYMGLLCNVF